MVTTGSTIAQQAHAIFPVAQACMM